MKSYETKVKLYTLELLKNVDWFQKKEDRPLNYDKNYWTTEDICVLLLNYWRNNNFNWITNTLDATERAKKVLNF